MHEEDERSENNIFPALKRYRWHLVIAIPLLMLVAVVVVLAIPPVYRSTASVMVETQQIPSSLVQSTVTSVAAQQIEIITQRVMTREKLAGIVSEHSYFGFKEASPFEQMRILQEFRENVEMDVNTVKSGRQRIAIGFNMSYDSDSPAVAQAIATKLVSLFLDENVQARTKRASDTTQFLRSEAEKKRKELEIVEAEVADFKNKYKESLPEHLELYVGMREDARRGVQDINESIAATNLQITTLKNQLTLSKEQGVVVDTGSDSELAQLKREYNRLLLQYQPDHPDLQLLKEKISQLEGTGDSKTPGLSGSEGERTINAQIQTLENRLDRLQVEKTTLMEKLKDLEERIITIPQVEREFISIKRNYESIQSQYQSLLAKVQSASVAESLEEEQKAERFTLLEPPYLPTRPYKPNRKQLLAFAVLGSMGLPIALVVLIGFLDKSIHSSESLTRLVGSPPLMEFPLILTREEIREQRKKLLYGIAIAVALVLVGLVLLNYLYMPLGELVPKVMARIGI